MKTFTDTAGRAWTITLNLGTALASGGACMVIGRSCPPALT